MDFLQQVASLIRICLIATCQTCQRRAILRRGLLVKVVLASHI